MNRLLQKFTQLAAALFAIALMLSLIACSSNQTTGEATSPVTDAAARAADSLDASTTPEANNGAPSSIGDTSARERPPVSELSTKVQAGDSVSLGIVSFTSYWGVEVSRDFAWRVLEVEDDRVLLITEDIIELRPYNSGNTQVAWSESAMREWLNGEFYNGLSDNIQKQIVATDTSANGSFADKVFLLSVDEANVLFASDKDRLARTTVPPVVISAVEDAYHLNSGNIQDFEVSSGGWYWWLRTPDVSAGVAAVVSIDGQAAHIGGVHAWGPTQVPDYSGVRPVIQVRVN
jgi:hypothetical protein